MDLENRLDSIEKHHENTLRLVDRLNATFEATLAKVDGMAFVAKLFSAAMLTGFFLFAGLLTWYVGKRDDLLSTHSELLSKLSTIAEVDHIKSQYLENTITDTRNQLEKLNDTIERNDRNHSNSR